jgi:hypothetical protein
MNPTRAEKYYWNQLAELGCIACKTYDARYNNYVSIHHIDGRTKKRKDGISPHMKVLALCHHHHQGKEGIHFMSRRVWEAKYGLQEDLKVIADMLLEDI